MARRMYPVRLRYPRRYSFRGRPRLHSRFRFQPSSAEILEESEDFDTSDSDTRYCSICHEDKSSASFREYPDDISNYTPQGEVCEACAAEAEEGMESCPSCGEYRSATNKNMSAATGSWVSCDRCGARGCNYCLSLTAAPRSGVTAYDHNLVCPDCYSALERKNERHAAMLTSENEESI